MAPAANPSRSSCFIASSSPGFAGRSFAASPMTTLRTAECPTMKAVLGNRIVPQYADYVLSKSGIEGQQTEEPARQEQL